MRFSKKCIIFRGFDFLTCVCFCCAVKESPLNLHALLYRGDIRQTCKLDTNNIPKISFVLVSNKKENNPRLLITLRPSFKCEMCVPMTNIFYKRKT